MASTSLTAVPTDSTTGSFRRRAMAAIGGALAAATVLAALVVAPPTPRQCRPPAAGRPHRRVPAPQRPLHPLGGVPGAAAAAHLNLNNRGQVIGVYPDDQGVLRSFVKDRRGRVTTFAVPGATGTFAAGINDRGQVAGTYFDDSNHGFIRQPKGQITTIELPGFDDTAVSDINNRDQVVGKTRDAQGRRVGFLREPGGRVTTIVLPGRAELDKILALNDRGQVAGTWDDRPETPTIEPSSRHGFVWDRGRLTRFDVPGSLATGALGINNAGQVTGAYDDAAGRHHRFVRQPSGRFTTIDAPGRTVTDAWGINDRGQILIPELGTGLAPVTR
jgi:uncharacterized membrane protein